MSFLFRPPRLDSAAAAVDGVPDPTAPIFAGSTLVLEGEGFLVETLQVAVGNAIFEPPAGNVTDTRVDVGLDPAAAETGPLVAGHRAVRAIAGGTSASEPRVVVVRPRVASTRVVVTPPADSEQEPLLFEGRVEITVVPDLAAGQELEMLLNDLDERPRRAAYLFRFAAVQKEAVAVAVVPFERVPEGTYLLRLRVDRAESVPRASRPGGALTRPRIVLRPPVEETES